MNRKKKRRHVKHGIPIIVLFGIFIAGIFWWLYGGMMLLRYMLGALMFATITVSFIVLLKKTFGKKVWKPW